MLDLPAAGGTPVGAARADAVGHAGPDEDFQHPMSIEDFRRYGKEMVDYICGYHASVERFPVRSQVSPGYLSELIPATAPEEGEDFQAIMRDVDNHIMPGMTHWQSPNFFAYYPANTSFPAQLADMLSAAMNIIGFSWITSPAATELETIVMDWLAALLGLPEAFFSRQKSGAPGLGGGVIQATASEATLVALLAARARALRGRPASDAARLVAYTSDQAHSCVRKACMVAGVAMLRVLPTTSETAWALSPSALAAAVEADAAAGLLPFFFTACLGSTSSCAVDPLEELGTMCMRHGLWMHVDAAYAGMFAILPEQRAALGCNGLGLAASFNTNAHKGLLTNFNCSCLWVQDAEPLKAALSLTPVFLRARGNHMDYKDWQVPLGRSFRALKLWFVLRSYGAAGLRRFLCHHLRLAAAFAAFVAADIRFELAAPLRCGLVCFRLKGASNAANAALLEAVNASGRAFIVHTELAAVVTLRFAVGGLWTQMRHVEAAWQLIVEHAESILQKGQAGGTDP